jgi:hypothetical protein
MNILGIIASSKFGDVGDYESIATVSVGSGGAANVEFTSIPGTYTHLQVRAISFASNGSYLRTQLNNDTATNYSWHMVGGNGSSAYTDSAINEVSMAGPSQATSTNIFCASIIDFLDYTNTNKYKTVRYLGGKDQNGSGSLGLHSGLWRSTSAITSIKFFGSGVNFPQYTHFALYGIRTA